MTEVSATATRASHYPTSDQSIPATTASCRRFSASSWMVRRGRSGISTSRPMMSRMLPAPCSDVVSPSAECLATISLHFRYALADATSALQLASCTPCRPGPQSADGRAPGQALSLRCRGCMRLGPWRVVRRLRCLFCSRGLLETVRPRASAVGPHRGVGLLFTKHLPGRLPLARVRRKGARLPFRLRLNLHHLAPFDLGLRFLEQRLDVREQHRGQQLYALHPVRVRDAAFGVDDVLAVDLPAVGKVVPIPGHHTSVIVGSIPAARSRLTQSQVPRESFAGKASACTS